MQNFLSINLTILSKNKIKNVKKLNNFTKKLKKSMLLHTFSKIIRQY